jgi:hypothetical protein
MGDGHVGLSLGSVVGCFGGEAVYAKSRSFKARYWS